MISLGIKAVIFLTLNAGYMKVVNSSVGPSFMISFQTSAKPTTEEWAEYKGKMPSLKEFTACTWFKVKFFQDDLSSLWSYCFLTNANTKIECFQLEFSPSLSSGNRNIQIRGWVSVNKSNTVTRADVVSFQHRKWNHICWTYSSISGYSTIYYNGGITKQ